ncbi:MAG TPA: bacteriohopanetetrol glucosamine biosynthesis glycosyltransferase HpnI [Terracidiphilus sp.]|jgi:ceramide glucosyltransferase|nr:bacteriohopanetetrol glucosamine biosynthesis glycosyltransferase HpnI [Terracidiphilus sp.]
MAFAVEIGTTVLAVAGMGYFVAALAAARVYLARRRAMLRSLPAYAPGVSVMKSLKGLDPGMMDAFRSHCTQQYAGPYELLFGVSSLDDPAAAAVEQLKAEFPAQTIRLVECPERLGTNGKVSTLAQLAPEARYDYLLINDSDITVGPRYLERVMACFGRADDVDGEGGAAHRQMGQKPVGLVTALYRGQPHGTLGSRMEALGIATDFQASLLLAMLMEGGLHFGLGSTLAVRRAALEKAGGLIALVDRLADDYEMGVRVDRVGYRVELSATVVETAVPAYAWSGFVDHQLRWLRTVRDARPGGYAGLVFTHGLGWALLNVMASGASPVSLWLLALSLFLRFGLAMTVGAEVLSDRQVLANLWLLPVRDVVAMGLWVAGFAGNTIVWRGQRFALRNGRLEKAG